MTIAGNKITVQSLRGRQYFKKNGKWREYLCLLHEGEKHYDIRITDTIPVQKQLELLAEEILSIVEEHKPTRAKRNRKAGPQ